MSHPIYPCLWFDGQAKEAATFYCSLFKNSSVKEQNPMVTTFELDGSRFMGLNGGPMFKPNASISFYCTLEDKEELKAIWDQLTAGGKTLMPLDKYDWSELYGWVEDKYGISWQLTFGKVGEVGKSIVPLLMFCGENQGKTEDAINFYTTVFDDAGTEFVARYEPEQPDAKIVHSRFRINNSLLMAMDSHVAQPFTFNEGISLVINCDTQQEIDHYWNAFTEKGKESMCGWCRDQYGVWWQVVPAILPSLMSDPERSQRVIAAFMKMKKFDIDALLKV